MTPPNYSRRRFLESAAAAGLGVQAADGAVSRADELALLNRGRPLPRIQVHADGHLLQTSAGDPFFWLADTAWRLIHAATADEATYYLQTRAAQGYNVIQCVVLSEQDGVRSASAAGVRPFDQENPARPNAAYFKRVVSLVDEAAALGLYLALLPAWGDKVTAPWGDGPRLFRSDNLPVAYEYARYLSSLLGERSNVLWMLGGDRPARLVGAGSVKTARKFGFRNDEDWTPIWAAMASGIAAASPNKPLILYHPQGGDQSTSVLLRDAAWLSVNGMQSGHGSGYDVPVWEWIARDYAITPPKPTLDLEPNYEDHPYNPWPEWDPASGYFRDWEVRRQLYRSVFAGACGATYGHHAVWQFANRRNGVINHADLDWTDATQRPAGRQAVYLRRLMESRPFFRRMPAADAVIANGERGDHAVSTRDRDGSYLMVYVPRSSQTVSLNLRDMAVGELRAWWFSPSTGIGKPTAVTPAGERLEIESPPNGPDWVFVLDQVQAAYPPPGVSVPFADLQLGHQAVRPRTGL